MKQIRTVGLFYFLSALFLLIPGRAQSAIIKSGILPDLDGDKKPDSWTSVYDGKTHKIEIHFTSGRKNLHLTLNSDDPNILLYACDINQDNTYDLILASTKLFLPIKAWLNNGHGNFNRTYPWWCLNLSGSDQLSGTRRISWTSGSNTIAASFGLLDHSSPFNLSALGLKRIISPSNSVNYDQTLRVSQSKPDALNARAPPVSPSL